MRTTSLSVLLLAALLFQPALPAEDAIDRRAVVEAYDAGRYVEALEVLRRIDAAGQADGPMLYRLYFCQRETGDAAAAGTLARARERLEADYAAAPTLEAGFYLSNALRANARISDATRVAAETTGRLRSGALPAPTDGMGSFQAGKLYADQQLQDEAATWYGRALELWTAEGRLSSPSASWAAGFLAHRAFEARDWATAERFFGVLDAAGGARPQDLDRLAIARVRQGRYSEAAGSWFKAVRLNPAAGDHARYSAQLAAQAADFETLPGTAPDGRPWDQLTPEDLAGLLLERAQFATDTLAEVAAAEESLSPERHDEITQRLDDARRTFVAAGLEFAIRGLPLRETAFQSGYAPMIFQSARWYIPTPLE